MADGAPFQCTDAHRSCEDAGDDEKAEEELEVETPRETAQEAANSAIAEDLFTSDAFFICFNASDPAYGAQGVCCSRYTL